MTKSLIKKIFNRNKHKEPSISWKDFHPLTKNGFDILSTIAGINVDDISQTKILNSAWYEYLKKTVSSIASGIKMDGEKMVDNLLIVMNKDRQDPFTEADVIEMHQKPKTPLYHYSKRVTEHKIRNDPQYRELSDKEIKQLYLDDLVQYA